MYFCIQFGTGNRRKCSLAIVWTIWCCAISQSELVHLKIQVIDDSLYFLLSPICQTNLMSNVYTLMYQVNESIQQQILTVDCVINKAVKIELYHFLKENSSGIPRTFRPDLTNFSIFRLLFLSADINRLFAICNQINAKDLVLSPWLIMKMLLLQFNHLMDTHWEIVYYKLALRRIKPKPTRIKFNRDILKGLLFGFEHLLLFFSSFPYPNSYWTISCLPRVMPHAACRTLRLYFEQIHFFFIFIFTNVSFNADSVLNLIKWWSLMMPTRSKLLVSIIIISYSCILYFFFLSKIPMSELLFTHNHHTKHNHKKIK